MAEAQLTLKAVNPASPGADVTRPKPSFKPLRPTLKLTRMV